MAQKFLIGGLALAIAAVIGFGLIDAGNVPQDEADSQTVVVAEVTETVTEEPAVAATPEMTAEAVTEAVIEVTAEAVAAVQPEQTPNPQPQAMDSMGEVWQAAGTITTIEDMGLTLTTLEGDYFVELGPPTYWQEQGVTLAVGDAIRVDGYYNGEQVHARVVTANEAELVIRSENGQPMWAGGASADNGNGDHSADGGNQVQVAPEDWVTLTGMIGNVRNGNVTLNVDDGTTLDLQMGQPNFWQSQGITLTAGDPVEVLGFWSGEQFMAGDIRKTATGETIMLRDPNGRQLWGGPGRNGNSGETQGSGNQGAGNQSTGDAGTQGNQYRGGR